ncbi:MULTISPECIES: DUF2087 domain-containing protein [Bacillaceae]|uniref:Transcriptional regulator n=1 Tax=Gottfriedia luciferensis TaxID=178774 RepID=A0ABX2ZV70_9BACI|nr:MULTISPECIES: DUF2087 domain-containing protein [Bacillaceae]ODG93101.1 transcriptional regulator [Gottfriedia luciferensis]PGZ91781.1 DUF2087 domain-containing protein [Bacillus sp. AFS029533]SFD08371.1 hypothetical protein SAMN02799633_02538 [Bacillus sp. UNCCL81]
MENLDVFWNADIEELKQGYIEEENHYLCLLCSKRIEKGIIYQDSGILYEAEKYMKVHIDQSHDSVFDYLIQLDKKLTGLTEHQNHLLRLFYQGKSDTDIQKETGIGSASTIRNHRFVLKEKERQAKLFLVMMELLKEKDQHAPSFLPLHKTAKMVDERYNITEDEMEKTLKKYFPEGIDGSLKKFPLKEKQKLVVLREIVKRFSPNKTYTEKEINEVLTAIYPDYVVLRRYLIEYGFIDRKSDGSSYWLKA